MKILHSFNAEPFVTMHGDRKLKDNMVMYATSLAWIHKHNVEVILYTDETGKKLFDGLGYDDIRILPENHANKAFWAASKMLALKDAEDNCVHIDGDVMIKDKSYIDILKNREYDVVVQGAECEDTMSAFYAEKHNYDSVIARIKMYYPLEKRMSLNYSWAPNNGVLGFGSEHLKNYWCISYLNLISDISMSLPPYYLDRCPKVALDLVTEQMYITKLLEGKYFKKLLDVYDTNDVSKFEHLFGPRKFSYMYKVADMLKSLDEALYYKVMQKKFSTDK